MKYSDAKKLHPEDEIVVKETGQVLHIIEVKDVKDAEPPYAEIYAEDGCSYLHTEIK